MLLFVGVIIIVILMGVKKRNQGLAQEIAAEHLKHDAPQIFSDSSYDTGKMLSLFGNKRYYAPSIDRKLYIGKKPPHFQPLRPDEEVTKEWFLAGINIYPRMGFIDLLR